jgi:hypothetical protein
MDDIRVNLLNSTKHGRLYYQPNPEIEPFVLFLQNGLKTKRTYSINIDSAIILDINENQVLQGAEFIIHRKVWKIDPTFELPHPEIEADIQIANLLNRDEIMETTIRSITDEKYRYVFFGWETENSEKKWVALSKQCYALISGTSLAGFFINLISENQE